MKIINPLKSDDKNPHHYEITNILWDPNIFLKIIQPMYYDLQISYWNDLFSYHVSKPIKCSYCSNNDIFNTMIPNPNWFENSIQERINILNSANMNYIFSSGRYIHRSYIRVT